MGQIKLLRKKKPHKLEVCRMGVIPYQTHADEVPEASEESLPSNKIYQIQSFRCP